LRIVHSAGLPVAPSAGLLAMAVHLGWASGFICGIAKYGAVAQPIRHADKRPLVPVARVSGAGMALAQTGSARS